MPDAGGRRSGPSVGLALSLGQLIGRAGLPRSRRREAALLGARRRSGGETGEAGGEEAGSPRLKCAASPGLPTSDCLSGPAIALEGENRFGGELSLLPVVRGLVLSTLSTAAISLRDSEGAPPPTVDKSYQGKSIS